MPAGVNGTTFSKVVFGVAATMSQLHSIHVIHRDLRPLNVFVNTRGEPVLTGFFFSRFYSESDQLTMCIGTPLFMAPELSTDTDRPDYSDKVDVYAYGLLLHSIFTDTPVLTTGRVRNWPQLIMRTGHGTRYVRPDGTPDAFWQLITECWDHDPDRRPSFADITERMMRCDDFTFEGTDMAEYHEYRDRIVRESSAIPRVDPSPVLSQLRGLGIDVDAIPGLARP
jgi:serine/threonine protein kinase